MFSFFVVLDCKGNIFLSYVNDEEAKNEEKSRMGWLKSFGIVVSSRFSASGSQFTRRDAILS
ncbi:hypothetical protein TFKS16_1571 [Tannerella forsythia KS16]|uniref:Uncharacterized protein n=1 Tax=Tannerella forsythia (strain ATCC 43037 / JCM 10827 / CCUG 21028 A / KCTC 5666 / FDC 338) TaxID=203275 RepID=G8UNK0_TANFA|nr:hypothetical protein BFO_1771 [Tannerella forsythia 92A2]BAR49129.1 hypothetical protein TF3313_1623 [Tannerella forsythia 3313]BAR51815.1 hypothetical protein TFKS16_1571 [Tannerella forsythia KS16]